MKVSATLKGQPDAHGRYAIYIRVNDGKSRTSRATKFRVTKDQFSKGKVVKHPQAETINSSVRVMIAKKEIGESVSVKDSDFAAFVDKCVSDLSKERSYETLRQYNGEKTKLQGFQKHVRLSQITPDFLRRYVAYCRSLGNQETTIWKTFKFIRMLLRRAINEKLIVENPFSQFVMPKYKDPKKIYLTRDQILLMESKLPELDDLRLVATWFLIGCFTGIRFGDMQAFDKKKHIKSGRLVMYTAKTGEMVSMPLSERVKSLLDSIGYRPLSVSNNHANDRLRGALAYCEITEPVTFHNARHSFAIMCAEAGISQEVTAKLLGHRSLRTTAIYYRITNPRIDAEVGRLG